ncbi:MAG: GFA family protein [Marinibacterium sp.]
MITGRCYCGKSRVRAVRGPEIVTYCHCVDCRRVTGAPVAAFAAFPSRALTFVPDLPVGISVSPGVRRWFCDACGSPLAAIYDYLPDQVYVPVGILDQAAELAPERHAHAGCQLPWLHLADELPRNAGSARAALRRTGANR